MVWTNADGQAHIHRSAIATTVTASRLNKNYHLFKIFISSKWHGLNPHIFYRSITFILQLLVPSPSSIQDKLITTLGKMAFGNIVGKGDNTDNQHFLFSHNVFYPIIALSQTSLGFYLSAVQAF